MANAYAAEYDNPLYVKLKNQYKDRGINRVNTASRPADAIDADVKIAQPKVKTAFSSVANPFEDTAKYERAGAETRMFHIVGTKAKATAKPGVTKEELAQRKKAAYEKKTPYPNGTYAYAYNRAAAIRAKAVEVQIKQEAKPKKRTFKQAKTFNFADLKKVFTKEFWRELRKPHDSGEREIVLPKISTSVIIGILIAVCILFILIYSFSQITAIKNEISTIDNDRETLCGEIRDLKLEIDSKNDVRLLEDKAEDLGMVKSNKVTAKYVNLATGEHIEVVGDEGTAEDGGDGIFSTMLSSVNSNLDNLFDYFN